jgi:hypothetical protein
MKNWALVERNELKYEIIKIKKNKLKTFISSLNYKTKK